MFRLHWFANKAKIIYTNTQIMYSQLEPDWHHYHHFDWI